MKSKTLRATALIAIFLCAWATASPAKKFSEERYQWIAHGCDYRIEKLEKLKKEIRKKSKEETHYWSKARQEKTKLNKSKRKLLEAEIKTNNWPLISRLRKQVKQQKSNHAFYIEEARYARGDKEEKKAQRKKELAEFKSKCKNKPK